MGIPRRTHGSLALLLLYAVAAYPQIFKLEGGTSSLLQSDGARLTITNPYFDSVFSVGQSGNGGLLYGAAVRKQFDNNTVTAGDSFVPFQMPNDVFAGYSYYSMRGVDVDHVTDRYSLRVSAGLTTTTEGANFFQTASKDNAFGSIQFDVKASDKLLLYGRMFFTNLQTAIVGFSYTFTPGTRIAFASGIGANKPYAGLSFQRETRLYELLAEYVAASLEFSRMFVETPRFTEPHRVNILGRYRPFRWLDLNASHQNSVDPYSVEPVLATIDSAGAGFFMWKAHFNGNAYHSTSAGIATNGISVTAGRSITRWLDIDADWFRSQSEGVPTSQIGDLRFTEKITQALTITEYLTRSSGQNSVLLGGTYNSRRISVSLTNNIAYVPFEGSGQHAGFQRFYSISVSFPFFHDSRAELNADIDQNGSVKYTAAGSTIFYRYEGLEPGSVPRFDIGKFLILGKVTDEQGKPVEGAVVRVGKQEAISDREGRFELRNHKRQTDALAVPVADFITSYDYVVVRAPSEVTYSADEGAVPETTIVVRRVSNSMVSALGGGDDSSR
jgi:hypothetical protein